LKARLCNHPSLTKNGKLALPQFFFFICLEYQKINYQTPGPPPNGKKPIPFVWLTNSRKKGTKFSRNFGKKGKKRKFFCVFPPHRNENSHKIKNFFFVFSNGPAPSKNWLSPKEKTRKPTFRPRRKKKKPNFGPAKTKKTTLPKKSPEGKKKKRPLSVLKFFLKKNSIFPLVFFLFLFCFFLSFFFFFFFLFFFFFFLSPCNFTECCFLFENFFFLFYNSLSIFFYLTLKNLREIFENSQREEEQGGNFWWAPNTIPLFLTFFFLK